jgi:hypothetical protein
MGRTISNWTKTVTNTGLALWAAPPITGVKSEERSKFPQNYPPICIHAPHPEDEKMTDRLPAIENNFQIDLPQSGGLLLASLSRADHLPATQSGDASTTAALPKLQLFDSEHEQLQPGRAQRPGDLPVGRGNEVKGDKDMSDEDVKKFDELTNLKERARILDTAKQLWSDYNRDCSTTVLGITISSSSFSSYIDKRVHGVQDDPRLSDSQKRNKINDYDMVKNIMSK